MTPMKKIVDGKLYDTETAKSVAKWQWSHDDGQDDSTLYANKNGAYFTVDKTAFGGEREFEPHLTPLTREQVQNRLLYAEKLEVFDEDRLPLPPEATPEDIEPTATICVPVPMSLKRRVEVAALRSGQGITALTIQCLKERCPA
jgi:hypothetical protein